MVKSKEKNVNSDLKLSEVETSNSSFNKFYLLLGIFTLFVFFNTIFNGYNIDDELVTRNHPVTSKGLDAIGEIFTTPYYSDVMGYSYGYRPIVHLTFALEHEIFGEKPLISHLINLLLYFFSVVLLFRFLIKLFGQKNLNLVFIAVLFFSVHPIHSEVVASIKNRDEILAFLFAMLAAINHLKFLGSKNNFIYLLLATIFFSSAILSKESVYPLVFVLPLFYTQLKIRDWLPNLFISISFVLPVFFIGLNISFSTKVAMILVPILWCMALVFDFKKLSLYEFKSFLVRKIKHQVTLIVLFIFSILGLVLTNYYLLIVFSLLIVFISLINFKILAVIFTSILMYCNYFIFGDVFVLELLLILLFVLFVFRDDKPSDSKLGIIIGVSVTLLLFIIEYNLNDFDIGIIVRVLGFLVLLVLNFNRIIGVISIFSIVLSTFLTLYNGQNEIPFILIALTFILVLIFTKYYIKNLSFKTFIFSLFLLSLFFSSLTHIKLNKKNNESSIVNTEKSIDNFKKGGTRPIEFVENTLVLSHTKSEKCATGTVILGQYFSLMFFPQELSFYYGYSKVKTEDFSNWKVWLSLIEYLTLIFIAIWRLSRNPILSKGIFWFVGSILLFSNWTLLVPGMVGERLAFTASAGFSLFIASLIFWIKPNFNFKKPRLIEISFLIIIVLFSLKTIHRNSQWKDTLTLMGNDIKHLQNSAQANNLYALNLLNNSRDVESKKLAIQHFKKAIKIYPDFFNVHFDLARNYLSIGDTLNSIKHFNKVIELDGSFQESYLSLVQIYNAKRDWISYLRIAKKLYKIYDHPDSYIILAKGYLENKNIKQSKKTLKIGVSKFPLNKDLIFCLNDLENSSN